MGFFRPAPHCAGSQRKLGVIQQAARPLESKVVVMSRTYDAIVLGVGSMGSAALSHLAHRNCKVLGIEQFDIPNAMGSSHGVTRIIRKAYFEHPSYVPLLHRAYELWRDLENTSGQELLRITGSLDIGQSGSPVLDGAIRSSSLHKLSHDVLSARQLCDRFPAYDVPSGYQAVYQPDGGFLLSEACVTTYCFDALKAGAELHGRERVKGWNTANGFIEVYTDRGEYRTNKLVVTAGAWVSQLLPHLVPLAKPERQVLAWFQPIEPDLFEPENFPVFVFNDATDGGVYYGFPVYGGPGFKIGRMHHLYESVNPDDVDRNVHTRDEELLRTFVSQYMPKASGPTLSLQTCMFTNTPDEHFIIERYPDNTDIVIACGFSGHGFKFASVVGEILADLATTGKTSHDIGLFKSDRFRTA